MNFINKFLNVTQRVVDDKTYIETTEQVFDMDLDVIKAMSEDELEEFIKSLELVTPNATCPTCNILLTTLYKRADRNPFFKCRNNNCSRTTISAYKNSIFERSKLTNIMILKILYNFSCRRTVADSAQTLNLSKGTVINFYKFFRAALFKFADKFSSKLGGDGIVIHFDETPITHRHGLLGRHMRSNTVWVVGAVDIHSRRCFLKFLPSRSRTDLFHFLQEWILPGSVVHTDSHRSYHTLSGLGFGHFTVNHSRNLVGPDGIHTNWIEGIFGCVKKLIRKYDAGFTDVANLELYLAEFCFRYSYDVFDRRQAFIKILHVLKVVKKMLDEEDLNETPNQ